MDVLHQAAEGFAAVSAPEAARQQPLKYLRQWLRAPASAPARHAACIYGASGIHAHVLPPDSPRFLATPELSFAIRQLHAHGGLNVSASHNPPDDNGGKFYDERGGQPVAPDDQIMADLVDQVTAIKILPWADALRSRRVHFLDDALHRAYIDLCRRRTR